MAADLGAKGYAWTVNDRPHDHTQPRRSVKVDGPHLTFTNLATMGIPCTGTDTSFGRYTLTQLGLVADTG